MADVEALLELGVRATVIESPVSDGKLAAYGLTREEVERRVIAAVSEASAAGVRVAFFGVDGSRGDLGFLERIYRSAVEAGASEIVVVDTIGAASPEAVELLVGAARGWVGDGVPVHFHGHDDFGLATAAAIAAVRAGATWVHGTVNGMGERAGNANLLEVALALEGLYGVETNLRLEHAREVSELVRRLSGYALEPWRPIVGENLFVRESGAVASQFHDPPAIEPYAADLVGAERRIVLGKKSGIDSIRLKCEELGLDVPEERRRELLAEVKRRGTEKRGLVTDGELREMIAAERPEEGP
jgi:isopropylmalate/homocitrate/citramalate synthase